jgi:hypothetical protein
VLNTDSNLDMLPFPRSALLLNLLNTWGLSRRMRNAVTTEQSDVGHRNAHYGRNLITGGIYSV